MKAIKKINNNVAICMDNNNKELVAFGKGIGFPKMPYEIVDLSLIDVAFYRIDSHLYRVIEEIPDEILEVSAQIVAKVQNTLNCNLNPNLVVSLADHINFAIVRLKKYKEMKMAFSLDIERLYPKETELGRMAVRLVEEKLLVKLPKSEITNIATHFINAEEENESNEDNTNSENLISDIAEKIEDFLDIKINKKDFTYNRFAIHIRDYINRIKSKGQFIDDVSDLLDQFKKSDYKLYECAVMAADYIDEKFNCVHTEGELFYLVIHIKRLSSKAIINN